MSKMDDRNIIVIILAYLYRYAFPFLPTFLAFASNSNYAVFILGIGYILYGAYGIIGYALRWKHIYCAFQNTYREAMTPSDIRWSKIKKVDAYGIPTIWGIFGIIFILLYYFS